MSDIKSAREIAMEKVAELGEATDEERLRWRYIPEGEKLAVEYIKQGSNLVVELSRYDENVRHYIIEGAGDILTRNISVPKDDLAKRDSKRAMDGLKVIKSDKVSVENVYSRMRHLFDHYSKEGEQQRQQAYERLKAEFEAKVQQAIAQQGGTLPGIKIDIERQPQFQEQWRKVLSQLESQYITLLEEYKHELKAVL